MDAPWRLVPAEDAGPPPGSTDSRARGWLRELLARLRPSRQAPSDVGPGDDDLRPIEQARLDRLAPPPPIAAQHAAVDAWRAHLAAGVVLRPEDGGWDDALGRERPAGVTIVAPPLATASPGGLPEDVADRLADPEPLHLTRLEGWFVRHHDDLAALRELLVALHARTSPWTADVSPRAWAWMRAQLPEAGPLPSAWTPAFLDGDALATWLGGHEGLRERSSGRPPDEAFYRALAARASGRAGVARAIWRACLHDGAEAARAAGDDDGTATVWVRAAGVVDLPGVTQLGRSELLVVHAALLHGPAHLPRLERSLASIRPQVAPILRRLAASGVAAADDDDRWRIEPEALPALTTRLAAEAFLGGVA